MISDLNALFSENVGSCGLHITIYDSLGDINVGMPSKTVKVNPCKALFSGLEQLDLEFKLK